MSRQFFGAQATGAPNDVLNIIRSHVRAMGCGHIVPVVYVERGASSRQFYVFLGVAECLGRQTPNEVRELHERMRYIRGSSSAGFIGPLQGPLSFEEIQSLVDSQEFDTTYSNRIPYRSRWVHDLGDVNDLLDTSDVAATSDPTLTARFDRLLTWLSSAGEGRWETFVHACQSLEICENATAARSVFRRLTLLGHIEASPDGREWMVGPPVLVRLPCYRNRYCWCGQRTEGWLNRLRVFGEVEQQNQLGSLAPSRVTIEFSDAVRAKIAADAEGLRFEWQEQPLCDVLVDHLFDLKGWQRSLESINGLTDLHTVERWEGQIFVRDTSFFIRNGRYHGQSGLYRVTRGEGQRQSCLVFYFDEQEQRLLRGDWYGLRFLALRQAGHRCHATWQRRDGDHGTLLLPASERWPMIYEKALVLASGFLPHHLSGRNLLCYQDVPYRTAEVLASKLGVELQVQEAR